MRRAQPGEEFSQRALVFGLAGEASQRMHAAGARGTALGAFPCQGGAAQANGRGALAQASEIDGQRPGAVQRAQGAEAVAQAAEEDREFGPFGQAPAAFQFGGGDESQHHAAGGRWVRIESTASTWTPG